MNRINLVIAGSTIALIALIIFQVQWMLQSRDLIEELFDNQVRMAMCAAIESVSTDTIGASCTLSTNDLENLDTAELYSEIGRALNFFQIPLEYEMELASPAVIAQNENQSYCCAVTVNEEAQQSVNVIFPDKGRYILEQMSFMLISSILILLFVSIVFVLANYSLIRQKRLNEINNDFFNNMAHEFRTPLASIGLATKLLQKKNKTLKDNQYLTIVQRESRKLLHQTERVLHLAKMENGEYQFQKETIELDKLIKQIIAEMQVLLQEKGAKLHFNPPQGNWLIEGDPFHLGNAFRNIIDNALKYASEEPIIEISLMQREGQIITQFKDNGLGICKADQQLIFKKFGRVSTGNVHNQKGFGLGLSYVKMIIEQHKGSIQIQSELDKGSQFSLVFPI